MKEWRESLSVRYYRAWKWLAVIFAVLAANSACGFPYYEPEQPEELAGFKRLGSSQNH